ncbi:MAG: hypothetical protein LBR89_04845 [Holosporales bacterium]|jgi:hypothetical protein|nr:hypothetical protein [Holosporales bacterium]
MPGKDHASQVPQDYKPSRTRLFHKLKAVPAKAVMLFAISVASFLYSTYKHNYYFSTLIPLQTKYINVTNQLSNVLSYVKTLFGYKLDLIKEKHQLLNTILEYENHLFDYERLQEENTYLRSMLPVIQEHCFETITVVPRLNLAMPFTALVYSPADVCDKIKIGDVVISQQGVVGRIVEKKQKGQREGIVVMFLATHIQSRFPVISSQSHQKAILCGQNSPFLKIQYANSSEHCETPFVENESNDFVHGEVLMLDGTHIPVATVIKEGDKTLAKWVIDTHAKYVTVVIGTNVLKSDEVARR